MPEQDAKEPDGVVHDRPHAEDVDGGCSTPVSVEDTCAKTGGSQEEVCSSEGAKVTDQVFDNFPEAHGSQRSSNVPVDVGVSWLETEVEEKGCGDESRALRRVHEGSAPRSQGWGDVSDQKLERTCQEASRCDVELPECTPQDAGDKEAATGDREQSGNGSQEEAVDAEREESVAPWSERKKIRCSLQNVGEVERDASEASGGDLEGSESGLQEEVEGDEDDVLGGEHKRSRRSSQEEAGDEELEREERETSRSDALVDSALELQGVEEGMVQGLECVDSRTPEREDRAEGWSSDQHDRGGESSEDGTTEIVAKQDGSQKKIRKSAKKAREELQEIYSEGQRMVRESSICLPYHQPPRLSLKEFLAIRRRESRNEFPPRTPDGRSQGTEPRQRQDDGVEGEAKPKSTRSRLAQLLEKELAARGQLNITPRLSREPLVVEAPPPGLEDLRQRFMRHAALGMARTERGTESPLQTDRTPSSITASTPVEKREQLRQQLLEQVLRRREHILEERLRQHKVDEDKVLSDHATPPESEDESAVEDVEAGEEEERVPKGKADEGDEVDEDDGEEKEEEEEEEEDIVPCRKRPKKRNPFIDDEADDEDDLADEEESSDEDDGNDDEGGTERRGSADKPSSNTRRLVLSDEDEAVDDAATRSGVNQSFALDDLDLFSPISGLTNVRCRKDLQLQECRTGPADAGSPNLKGSKFAPGEPLIPLTPLFDLEWSSMEQAAGARPVTGGEKPPWQSSQPAASQQDMDELLGLCSGSFAARTNSKPCETVDEDSQEVEDDSEDNIAKDSDNEDEEVCEEVDGDSVEDDDNGDIEEAVDKGSTTDAVHKERFLLRDFLEDEAELSGSDVGSDEEDIDEDEEQVLADLLATDTQPLDEESLREEVGRLHFKQLLDRDKRELKVYQEMLLEDGDLHSEGGGRQRKFRWKHSDADFMDCPQQSDSEEGEQGEQEEEVAWRLQRFEREQWLREQASKGVEKSPEKIFSSSMRVVTSINREKQVTRQPVACGSFLKMGNDALRRIAERFKASKAVDNTGALTTKLFVFRATEKKEAKRPSGASLPGPSSKKQKMEVPVARGHSVFDYL